MESRAESLEVLVLCASPVGDLVTLKLAHELVQFENELRKAQVPVRLKRVFPPTIQQLRRELAAMSQRGERPGVFHFLGHGDDDGLYFEDEFGESQLVKGAELKQALAESPVKLVLLNACWSATKRGVSLVEFLQREAVTETAIGHEVPVADVSAVRFAQRFYELAMSGKSVRAACQQAANSLAEAGLPGAADVKLVGNGELKLTDGLPIGQRAFVSDDGMPTIGHLPDASVFFGRKEQLLAISRALSDSSLVGVGVWGIGGIGKTALVLAAARRNAWRYRGTAWVDIREATQKTTAELLRLALGRLSPGANSDDPQHALSQFLKGTPSLIVLDNLEDLPESEVPALARFLNQIPRNGSHVMLTARVPLKPVEEVPDVTSIKLTEGLDGWHGPHYVQHVARQKKCLALQDELRREHGELETTITGLEGLCVLVSQRLHGHPKMLELAVGLAMQGEKWLNDALASLPEHLEDQLAPLLETSMAALKENGRKVLPYLRFFPTSEFTFETLEVACGVGAVRSVDSPSEGENNEVTWIELGTQQLVSAGILDYQQTTDTFRFHQLIADDLSATPSGSHDGQVQNHLLGYYLKYLADNHDDDRMLSRCIREVMVYLERLWRQSQRPPDFDRLLAHSADIVAGFAERQGFADVADTWNERSVFLFRLPHLSARRFDFAHALYRFGMGRIRRGDTELAEQCFHEAMGLLSADGDSQTVSAIHHALAQLEQVRGNVPKAYEHAKASVELQNAITLVGSADGQNRIRGIHFLAILELQLRQVPTAKKHFEEALRFAEDLGDENGIAHISRELGSLERQHGNLERGRQLLHRAREGFERSFGGRRDLNGLAATLNELGLLERHCGNFPEARRLFEQAIQIGASCHDRVREAESLHELAMLLEGMGEMDDATEYLTRSAQMSDDNGDRRGAAASRHRLAALLINQGQFDEARQILCEVEQVLLDAHDPKDYSDWLHSMASLEVGSRQLATAREYAEKSVAIKRAIPDHDTLATALVTLGHIAILEKKSDEAMQHVDEAVEFASRCGAIGGEFSARSLLAQLLAKAGDLRAAVQEMETVLTIAASFGASRSEPAIQVFQMIWLNRVRADLNAFDGQEYDCAMREIEVKLSQANDAVEQIRWLLVQSIIAARHLNRELSTESIKAARELGKQQRLLEPGYRMVFDETESQIGEFSEKMPNSLQLLIQGLELLGFHETGRPKDVNGALKLLTQAEAAARDENNGFALATCLLHQSDAMLHLERSAEAIQKLREALDIATQAEEAGLIKEIQETLTVAVQMAK